MYNSNLNSVLLLGDFGGGFSKGKGRLTSVQREKKRQKRHRYRERKRLERKVESLERMEKASESSNSVDITDTLQQSDTKTSFRHKKLSKKDKFKPPKVASENEEPNLRDAKLYGSPLPQCDVTEEMSSGSSNTTEELPKSRVSTASYAENTTSGDDPSSADDANMFPTCDTQHQSTIETQVTKTIKTDQLPSTSSCSLTTKTHTDA